MSIYSNDHKRIITLNTLLDVSLQNTPMQYTYVYIFSAVKIDN